MNIKVLATLGVLVALLSGWLLVSLYAASTVEVSPSAQEAAEELSAGSMDGAALGNEEFGVRTSVNVANQDVETTVRVAE